MYMCILYSFSNQQHLGCLHILAIVNNTVMKESEDITSRSCLQCFWIYIHGNGTARSYDSSIINFWGYSILFSIKAIQIYILTNSVQGCPFLHILSNNCLSYFWEQAFWCGRWYISLWFWFAFPWWLVMLSIYPYLLTIWMSFQIICFCFLAIVLDEFLIYFGY